jgi:hypothetical protein
MNRLAFLPVLTPFVTGIKARCESIGPLSFCVSFTRSFIASSNTGSAGLDLAEPLSGPPGRAQDPGCKAVDTDAGGELWAALKSSWSSPPAWKNPASPNLASRVFPQYPRHDYGGLIGFEFLPALRPFGPACPRTELWRRTHPKFVEAFGKGSLSTQSRLTPLSCLAAAFRGRPIETYLLWT